MGVIAHYLHGTSLMSYWRSKEKLVLGLIKAMFKDGVQLLLMAKGKLSECTQDVQWNVAEKSFVGSLSFPEWNLSAWLHLNLRSKRIRIKTRTQKWSHLVVHVIGRFLLDGYRLKRKDRSSMKLQYSLHQQRILKIHLLI